MALFYRLIAGSCLLAFAASAQKPTETPPYPADKRPEPLGLPKRADKLSALLPGKQPDGSVLLPNQWSLRPVGKQVPLGDFPINIAVHPGGRFAAVLHTGYNAHQILIVDILNARVAWEQPVHESFYGLEFASDGKKLFCSGAGDEVVHVFEFEGGRLHNARRIRLRDSGLRAVPAGLVLDRTGKTVFVANLWADRVTKAEIGQEPKVTDIVLRPNAAPAAMVPVSPSARDFEDEAATKREEASRYRADPEDTFPYACRLDEKAQRLYVSLWAQAAVAVVDLKPGEVFARWQTQEHPCEMALTRSGKRLFVANSARNTVTVLDTSSGKPLETISAALYPNAPPGSTPNSLALSPDEKMLFVANADNNNVAVFDVTAPGKGRSLGFIPVGWYPTSVRVTPDGKHLLVANGKGGSSLPNPKGPIPGVTTSSDPTVQFIARLLHGSMSIIELPNRAKFERQLLDYTAQAYQCCPRSSNALALAEPAGGEEGLRLRERLRLRGSGAAVLRNGGPIKYCIYIIKENRTYDQVLGDMPQGNGDPSLCLFPERVTPNAHKIARDFVLLDNFYVDAEVSADGHEWSMGAYATDFVEKMWPLDYGHNRSKKFPYPAEGYFPIACPAGGYLWDRAAEAGVTYRSYGEFVDILKPADKPTVARVKGLRGHIDEWYRGFDLGYSDRKRAARFIAELKRFDGEGEMPRLQFVRLPNDHTHGATKGFPTPSAYVGENDVALGQVVEAVSHSRFWPQTAIFVLEDDAQNGPDHVDAHRSPAYLISPYIRRGSVDSTMYSTSSMLHTMELILGLKPMSQYDSAATPMVNAFQAEADTRPFDALPANVDLEAKNPETAWGGKLEMNFAREDAADDLLLNEVIWRSVKGADSEMPAPVRAAFVRSNANRED